MNATGSEANFKGQAGGSPPFPAEPLSRIEVGSLLAKMGTEISMLTGIEEIPQLVGFHIGDYLGLSGCVFVELDDEADIVKITHEWCRDQVPPTLGKHRMNEFFINELQASSRAGAPFVVADTATDPRTSADSFAALEIGSFVSIPVFRNGVWSFSISGHRSGPHEWQMDEVGLLTQIAFLVQAQLDRIRAEETSTRLAAIVESSKDAICSHNLDGIITSWNNAAKELFGYHANEAIGRSIMILSPEDRIHEENAIMARIRRGEGLERYETLRRAKDGRLVNISLTISPILDIHGKVVEASHIARELDDIVKMERTLRENNQRMTLATRATGVGVWEWNILTDQVHWDTEMFRIYGLTPTSDGMVSYSVWQNAVLPEDLEEQEPLLQETIKGRSPGLRDFRIRKADTSEIRYLQLVDAVRCNAHGQAEWVVGTNLDITDRKRAIINANFLASVTDDLVHFSNLKDLEKAIGLKIAKHLEVDCCFVKDMDGDTPQEEERSCVDESDKWQGFDLSEYVAQRMHGSLVSGQCLVIDMPNSFPDETLAVHGIQSLVVFPIIDHDKPRFLLSLCHSEPRVWREDEIELIKEVAGRLWTRLEHARAERSLARALAASERQRRLYNTVLSNTPDFIYVFDLNHRFVYINDALLKVYGVSWEEAEGRDWIALGYEKGHAEQHDREIDQVIATKKPIRGEIPFTGTTGRRIYDYIFVPVLNAQGEVEAVAGTTRDITQRKQAEAAQAAERKVFERIAMRASLVETLDTLLLETEVQSEHHIMCSIHLMEKNGRELTLGAAPSLPPSYCEAVSRMPIGPNAGSCGTAAYERKPIFVGNIPTDPRWANYKDVAEAHHLRACYSLPIFSLEGEVLGTVAMYYPETHHLGEHDQQLIERARHLAAIIIERKQAEAALAEQTASLLRADHSKNEFLAMLAHELRNPLAPIRHATEILRNPAANQEDQERARQLISRQTENMSRIIDDLMDVSRITEGKIELRRQNVELGALLSAAAETARHSADANGQQLTVVLPKEPVFLHADPTRIEQILVNLLGNACKYSGAGSHIQLAAKVIDGHAEIRVADDGIGIAPELMPRIFELFVQSSRTLDRSHGGLGIGLTIVDQLVKLHGGTVEAHSPGLGQGAEFVIRLPLLPVIPVEEQESSAPAAPPKSLRILIVDDNLDAAETMAMLQEYEGHETRTAHTGPEALAQAADFMPQVVLLDIGLPEMDGYEVARRIRAMPEMKNAFLIAITGYGSEADRRKAAEAGFNEHLSKPADLEMLGKWIRQLS